MKKLRKHLAILLALCLMLPLGVTALAEDAQPTFDYVVLGASMTNGYGMHGYLLEHYYEYPNDLSMDGPGASGYRSDVPGSYPVLIKNELMNRGFENVTLHQLAQSSMRVEELRYLLDDSFNGDAYTRWRFYDQSDNSGWWSGNLDGFRKDYQDTVRDAELITYDMGVNNFGVYISNQLMGGLFGTPDFADIVGEEYAGKFYELRDEIHGKILSLVGQADSDIFEKIDKYADVLGYAMLGFIVNFDATMKIIRDLNPDCDIVVVSIQNPMAGLDVSVKGIVIPFGEIYGLMTDMANSYMAVLSPYHNEYSFADVRQNGRVTFFYDEMKAYNGDPNSLSQNIQDCFNVYDRKIHANQAVKEVLKAEGIIPANVAVNNNLPYEGDDSEIYNEVLTYIYDVLARFMQAAANIDTLPLDGILAGEDMGEAGDALMNEIRSMLKEAARDKLREIAPVKEAPLMTMAMPETERVEEKPTEELPAEIEEEVVAMVSAVLNPENDEQMLNAASAEEEKGFDLDAAIAQLLSTDARKVAAAFGMRTSIGNTFFTHPSPQGHREVASAVMRAWDKEISGRRATAEAINALEQKAIDLGAKYGSRIFTLLSEKIVDSNILLNDEAKAYFKSLIPSNADAEAITKAILKTYGVYDIAEYDSLLDLMNKLDVSCEKHPESLHVHTPIYHIYIAPTCTSDGRHACFRCSGCGKLYEDYACTKELNKDEIAIPATGHELVKVPAKAATMFAPGNIEYYICARCGKWYANADGTKQIYNPLDVVTPKLSLFSGLGSLFA